MQRVHIADASGNRYGDRVVEIGKERLFLAGIDKSNARQGLTQTPVPVAGIDTQPPHQTVRAALRDMIIADSLELSRPRFGKSHVMGRVTIEISPCCAMGSCSHHASAAVTPSRIASRPAGVVHPSPQTNRGSAQRELDAVT